MGRKATEGPTKTKHYETDQNNDDGSDDGSSRLRIGNEYQ